MSQNDIATPASPEIATSGNLSDALYAFVAQYALPAMDGAHIFHANQNRASLPAGVEDYAVIGIVSAARRGTAVEDFLPGKDGEKDRILITSLFEYLVRIDLYSNGERARQRAMTLANVGRSGIGPGFFKRYGCSLLYADDPRDAAVTGDANQYVSRWTVQLRASMPERTTVELPGFDVAAVSRLENVHVHHPE